MSLFFVDIAGRSYNYGAHGIHNLSGGSDSELYFLDGNDVAYVQGYGVPIVDLGYGDDWLELNSLYYAVAYGGEGDDTIYGTNHTNHLYGGQGNDVLVGKAYSDYLYGGGWSDDVYGGGGNDHIYGDQGDDDLNGEGGNDSIYGGDGNDVLRGGSGDDRMSGDEGDDHYEVTEKGDRVLEHKNEGRDAIFSFIDFTLDANVEDMILVGGNDIDATGNSLANGFAGNTGDNVIKGLGGADNLDGREGKDKLYGGSGKDFFSFTVMGSANADKIMDFSHKDDTILLERNVFTGISTPDEWIPLKSGQFARNKDGQAKDSSDRILYDTTDGKLYWDVDGKGGQGRVHFATIEKAPSSLSHDDFLIV
jgi:Ca2+-binding RTX toxin-like protein